MKKYLFAFIFFLLLLVPVVSAAPEIRDLDLATVLLQNNQSYIERSYFGAGSEPHIFINPEGEQFTVTTQRSLPSTTGRGRFYFDGTFVLLSDTAPTSVTVTVNPPQSGNAVDGTWTERQCLQGGFGTDVRLSIHGKTWICGAIGDTSSDTDPVSFWNWHTATDSCFQDGCGNPNDFRFFVDTPESPNDDPNPKAFTTDSTVTCPATITVNGLWSRGTTQTLNTFAFFYVVQGDFRTDPDLSDNIGVVMTTNTDKGSGQQGSHSASTFYNNAAGNSYQLVVRNGTNGQNIFGAVNFVTSMQCNVPFPVVTGFIFDPTDFDIEVSHAPCIDQQTGITANIGSSFTSHVTNVTIINAVTNVPVLLIQHSDFQTLPTGGGQHVHYISVQIPDGTWTAIGRHDVTGVGAFDHFTSDTFVVTHDDCFDNPIIIDGEEEMVSFELGIIAWIILVAVTAWATTNPHTKGVAFVLAVMVVFFGLMVLPQTPMFIIISIAAGAILAISIFMHDDEKETEKKK